MNNIKSCTLQDSEKIEQVLLETWLAKNSQEAHEIFIDEINKWDQYFLATDETDNPLWIVSWKTEWRPRHGLYELYHIWVLEKARWSRVAKDLFDTLVNHAKELYKDKWFHLRKFYLKTGEQNIWAHKFYKKMWMTQTDILLDHFAKWRNELIFHLFLDENWNIIKD